MAILLGLDCKLYRGEAGETARILMENVKDVTVNLESGESDTTTRKSKGWRTSKATLKDGSIEFSILYDTDDEDYNALQEAYFSNKSIAFLAADDQDNGLDADFTITNFSMEQNLEEAVSVSVTAKPTDAGRAPVWKTGAGA